jgi:DNA-directed RNA polymerase specialized sigma24 family protein
MPQPSFEKVDFREVLYRLTQHAQNLSAAFVCLLPLEKVEKVMRGGESAGDLAMEVITKFLDPLDSSVAWSDQRGEPTTAKVLSLLRKVLERDFFDLKRSMRYKTTVYLDTHRDDNEEEGDASNTLDHFASRFDSPEREVIVKERTEWILRQFDGEAELKEIVKLQLEPGGYNAFTNQELAEIFGTTVKNIENCKKRIKARLRKLAASSHSQGENDVEA